MMNEDQIKQRIKEILGDERLFYPTANIMINAPLALVQICLETELNTLERVIGGPVTNVRKARSATEKRTK